MKAEEKSVRSRVRSVVRRTFSDLMSPWPTCRISSIQCELERQMLTSHLSCSSIPQACEQLKCDPLLLDTGEVWLGAYCQTLARN